MNARKYFINIVALLAAFMAISLTGCTSLGSIIKTNAVLSVVAGTSTSEDVIKIMGEPQKTKENELVYYYIDLRAKKDSIYIQESHFEIDSNNIVRKIIHTDMKKGGDKVDAVSLLKNLSSLQIGSSNIESVKNTLYPSEYLDYYENGILQYKQLIYVTMEAWNRSLSKLPYIKAKSHKSGESYSIFFSPDDLLTKAEKW